VVTELNSAAADLRPNVRKDGLEIVFDSNRPGTLGGFDIYSATRESVDDPWSAPVNLVDCHRRQLVQRDVRISPTATHLTYALRI
jgi:hypothetical protein